MRDIPIPWIGLAAVIAMFVLPFLPNWLVEGPRTTKHWPRRHICGECGAPWTHEHTCAPEAGPAGSPPLQAEVHHPTQQDIGPRALTGKKGTIARFRARGG
jgi:hypothetical protein